MSSGWSCGDEREERKKRKNRKKKKEGKSTRGYISAEVGKEEGRGAKRPEEDEGRGAGGRDIFSGIRAKLKSRRAERRWRWRYGGEGGGGEGRAGNEGIRSCDCTKFAVRTAASFRRDRNMHW